MLCRKMYAGHRALFSNVLLNQDKVCMAQRILRQKVCRLHIGSVTALWWQQNFATNKMSESKNEAFILTNNLNSLTNHGGSINRSYYKGPVTPIDKIKSSFLKFEGGSVDLVKDDSSGVARLKLNHPEKCNAMTGSMMCDLHDALTDLQCWQHGKGLILHAQDCPKKFFCSGGHLETVREISSHELGFQMSTLMNTCASMMRNLPLLSVCLVQGPALGGGAELTTLTDLRLATSDAWIAFVQCKMGVSTGWGGGLSLVRTVGYPVAMDLLISGRKLTFQEGSRIGYFNGEISKENSVDGAIRWMNERLENCDPLLIKNTKAILRQEIEITDEHREIPEDEYASRLFAELWHGPSHQAALKRNTKHK
eukprot:TRINITY_DN3879_c0_g1_i2.p1 TRINITY_DN3879_c0_g1~~TRINITY_DN3879_c0_g1_i2.p1  ORF type:complete len:366 (+),score=52.36 TRINITY_DN3879_c0_g1_i2:39-1136(+)